ncbi:ATP-binding protein [Actinocorallia sp. B10E7]|uniref:ATP-binding protein n=1 Tax=Actinocorallia sp. B10E7 TaxID=3153558 RepID=UPI00325D3358
MFIETRDGECWRREFPGDPEQARAVRRFVGALLADCPFADEVLLGCGELVANTVRHTRSGLPGGRFTVEVRRWRGTCGAYDKETELVALCVSDQGGDGEPNTSFPEDEYSETGRGLWTVAQTAASWGWFGGPAGRSVCAVFAPLEFRVV